jgi:diacylglycerol kinase
MEKIKRLRNGHFYVSIVVVAYLIAIAVISCVPASADTHRITQVGTSTDVVSVDSLNTVTEYVAVDELSPEQAREYRRIEKLGSLITEFCVYAAPVIEQYAVDSISTWAYIDITDYIIQCIQSDEFGSDLSCETLEDEVDAMLTFYKKAKLRNPEDY